MSAHAGSARAESPPQTLFALRSATGVAAIVATVLASTVGFVDAYMINVAVPAIGLDFSANVGQVQLVLTGYLVAVAALLLLAGALADHFGRRRVLIAGLFVILVASVGAASAPSIELLITARLIQGVGGALVVPSSLSLLNGTLREADRPRGIGVWAGLATLGTTVGPFAGGWLVDHASWRYVFLLNIPLIAAAIWALRWVPEVNRSPRALSLDLAGALLAVLGLGGVIYALSEAPSSGWARVPVLVAGITGLVFLSALVPVERRQPGPMVRTSLFLSRQFDGINAATILFYGALSAGSYLVVLQCELRLGYTATAAGAALIPESVVFLVVSPFAGAVVARFGTRWPMAVGILVVAGAFALLSDARPGESYAEGLLPGALLWGLGIGIAVTPLTAGVLASVDDADLGEASAINDAASRLGGVVVIALVPALLGAGRSPSLAGPLVGGYQPAMLVMTGLAVTAAVLTVVFVSRGRSAGDPMPIVHPRLHSCALPQTSGVESG